MDDSSQKIIKKYFVYVRKSSEQEDRQALSLSSQKDEIEKMCRGNRFIIIDTFEESFSAKAPGRKVFNEMIRRINADAHLITFDT